MKRKKSVLVDDMEHCVICGREAVNLHHVLFGNFGSGRKHSDQDGYVIPLCHNHHTGKEGIHFNKDLSDWWKRAAQRHFEQAHSRKEFIERYGRSYL